MVLINKKYYLGNFFGGTNKEHPRSPLISIVQLVRRLLSSVLFSFGSLICFFLFLFFECRSGRVGTVMGQAIHSREAWKRQSNNNKKERNKARQSKNKKRFDLCFYYGRMKKQFGFGTVTTVNSTKKQNKSLLTQIQNLNSQHTQLFLFRPTTTTTNPTVLVNPKTKLTPTTTVKQNHPSSSWAERKHRRKKKSPCPSKCMVTPTRRRHRSCMDARSVVRSFVRLCHCHAMK